MKKARELIEKYALGKRVAAAVSGGEDSMALLSLLSEYAREGELTLTVVNVDHCIRENSAADSGFVRAYCASHGIEFIGKRIDIPAVCALSGRGYECEGHFARREFFTELIGNGRVDLVATAHHARDNVETVLLHLFRGSGLKGLSGMDVLSADGIFRPLLTTGKEEISAYIKEKKIPFVTDESNYDESYDRNYVRHTIMPTIGARFPAFESAVLRCSDAAAEAEKILGGEVCDGEIKKSGGAVSFDEKLLSPRYIFAALGKLGRTRDVYSSTVKSVMSLRECKDCARVDIGDGIVAAKEYGSVVFYRHEDRCAEEVAFTLPEGKKKITFGGVSFIVERVKKKGKFGDGKLYFDGGQLPEACVLRSRKDADRFTPYGGGGKKLKKYLIDEKIPARRRDALPLVCSGGEVLVIVGVEISDKIKLTGGTEKIYAIYPEATK